MSESLAIIVTSVGAMFLEVMAVQITRRYMYDTPILDLAGRFVAWTDRDGTSLRMPVTKLVSEGHVNVLVGLTGVTDIDAHGLGELAWGLATLRRSGGQMALVAPSLWVRRLLALTRLDTIVAIYDSEFDAIASTPRGDHGSRGQGMGTEHLHPRGRIHSFSPSERRGPLADAARLLWI